MNNILNKFRIYIIYIYLLNYIIKRPKSNMKSPLSLKMFLNYNHSSIWLEDKTPHILAALSHLNSLNSSERDKSNDKVAGWSLNQHLVYLHTCLLFANNFIYSLSVRTSWFVLSIYWPKSEFSMPGGLYGC